MAKKVFEIEATIACRVEAETEAEAVELMRDGFRRGSFVPSDDEWTAKEVG